MMREDNYNKVDDVIHRSIILSLKTLQHPPTILQSFRTLSLSRTKQLYQGICHT